MKVRVIGLMLFLFAGNVAAEEVHLWCEGTVPVCDEFGGCDSVEFAREIIFNESEKTFSYLINGKASKVERVDFSEASITGELKGDWRYLGKDIEFELNRYTGVLNVDPPLGRGWQLGCKKLEKQEKLF